MNDFNSAGNASGEVYADGIAQTFRVRAQTRPDRNPAATNTIPPAALAKRQVTLF